MNTVKNNLNKTPQKDNSSGVRSVNRCYPGSRQRSALFSRNNLYRTPPHTISKKGALYK